MANYKSKRIAEASRGKWSTQTAFKLLKVWEREERNGTVSHQNGRMKSQWLLELFT
jgi:hypothetical protein